MSIFVKPREDGFAAEEDAATHTTTGDLQARGAFIDGDAREAEQLSHLVGGEDGTDQRLVRRRRPGHLAPGPDANPGQAADGRDHVRTPFSQGLATVCR